MIRKMNWNGPVGVRTLHMGSCSMGSVACTASRATLAQRSERPHLSPRRLAMPFIITVARPNPTNKGTFTEIKKPVHDTHPTE